MTRITKRLFVIALACILSAGISCVSPDYAFSAQGISSKSAQNIIAAIESISLIGDGDAAELVIKLSSPATYTSYKTTSPLRLVVDLSQTAQGSIPSVYAFNKGNFKTVNVSRYDTDAGVLTRLDVELVTDADAVLMTSQDNPGELKISFPGLLKHHVKKDEKPVITSIKELPQVKVIDPVNSPDRLSENNKIKDSDSFLSSTNNLHTFTGLSVDNNTITLAVIGGVSEFKSFKLSNPERFVVDLFSVKSSATSNVIPVSALGISSARLGVYPDKLRIVFDASNGKIPDVIATKSLNGLTIAVNREAVNDSSQKNQVKADSTADQNKPTKLVGTVKDSQAINSVSSSSTITDNQKNKNVKSSEQLSVEMIDFQVVEGISRVAVKVNGDVSVNQPVNSPGFVTLTINNARLPKHLQRSLEAKGFVSPVLRVTPIIVKTRNGADTVIRIAIRKKVPYEFRHEGDMLFIDFKNPIETSSERIPADFTENKQVKMNSNKQPTNKDLELNMEFNSHSEPAGKLSDSAKLYKGRKVTLEFADAEVRKIFQLLSEVSNKNFVLGDDVTGSISIKLVNVPWDQALDIILDTKGLDKREDGNIIIIKGKGKFKSQVEEDLEIKKQQYKSIELKSETFNVNYADIGGIVSQFNALKSERGAISPDARTNKVIVKDIPQVIEDMRKLLVQLDIPEKQVMIEARIVEATSTFTRSLGVNWGIHYRDGSASLLGINNIDTGFGGLTSAPPISGTSASAGGNMGISFGTLTSNVQLDMRLSAAASIGLIKIVSSPKVATLNNKTAKITQGQQIPYTSATSDKSETKFIEAALALEVTPHINANGTIGMKIDAKNDSPGQATGSNTAPPINKKQATTEMLLRDGETTVIGGIFVDSDNESDDGVPYLMDIPLLGKLFKSNTKTKTKSELLIFITPRILGNI